MEKTQLRALQLLPGQHRARAAERLALPRRARATCTSAKTAWCTTARSSAAIPRSPLRGVHHRRRPPRIPHGQKLRPALHGRLRAPDVVSSTSGAPANPSSHEVSRPSSQPELVQISPAKRIRHGGLAPFETSSVAFSESLSVSQSGLRETRIGRPRWFGIWRLLLLEAGHFIG